MPVYPTRRDETRRRYANQVDVDLNANTPQILLPYNEYRVGVIFSSNDNAPVWINYKREPTGTTGMFLHNITAPFEITQEWHGELAKGPFWVIATASGPLSCWEIIEPAN